MKATIAFDVDDTLIKKTAHGDDAPNYEVIRTLMFFYFIGCPIYVWSGGGIDYAEHWCRKLGIWGMVSVIQKGSIKPDIVFDDEEVTLGVINIKI